MSDSPNWLRDAAAHAEAARQASPAAILLQQDRDIRARAAELVDAMPVPAAAADWADLRRTMLLHLTERVLWQEAHPEAALRVPARITPKGRLVWTAEAPLRHEAGPGQGSAPLAARPGLAADEMRANLPAASDEWHRHVEAWIEAPRAARRDAFRRLAEALYGPDWISPASRALDISLRTVQRWAAGERGQAPSEGALRDLRQIAAQSTNRLTELRRWIAEIEAASAAD